MSSSPSTNRKNTIKPQKLILYLLSIWLVSFLIDRIWFSLDRSVPSWDPADYLNGVMLYKQALTNPDFHDASWWRSFWLISKKIPPLIYIITGLLFQIFPPSLSSGNLVFSAFNLLLIISIFYLGKIFFNEQIALLACILSQFIPGLYYYRQEFLLDFPLTVIVTVAFTFLSYWYFSQGKSSWWLSILSVIFLGLGLLLKQTFLFFLFFPFCWIIISTCWQKKWSKLLQIVLMSISGLLIFYPWYRTNWLVIFTSGKRASIDSAIIEGDPPLNTLKAWTFYGEVLPYLISSFLFLIALMGIIYLCLKYFSSKGKKKDYLWHFAQKYFYQHSSSQNTFPITVWLKIFILGAYFLSSLNVNKDARYVLPLLPVLTLLISAGIFSYQGAKETLYRIIIVSIAFILTIFNLFPLGGEFLTDKLSPKMTHYPYREEKWATPEVIPTAVNNNPYLRMNIGVLPSTSKINQSNISFYGANADFQVYGRQVGVREKEVPQDVNALDWFLTKTGEQGSIPDAQKTTVELVENNGKFALLKQWLLPDQSYLQLYQKKELQTIVEALTSRNSYLKLSKINYPTKTNQGRIVDISYNWVGTAEELQNTLVLMTWYSTIDKSEKWTHDHIIGMSNLYFNHLNSEQLQQDFQVIENTAMFIPANIPNGNYILEVTTLNRITGKTNVLKIPKTQITIDNNTISPPAQRELDLVSEINRLAPNLSQGILKLDPIFANIGRINQYDPTQAYLSVTEELLQYRLQTETNLNYLYTLLLAQVLQQKVNESIVTAQKLRELSPDNAYTHAYLSFLYAYDWQGKKSEKALQPALKLAPEVTELKYLQGISALQQGNLWQVWQTYQQLAIEES